MRKSRAPSRSKARSYEKGGGFICALRLLEALRDQVASRRPLLRCLAAAAVLGRIASEVRVRRAAARPRASSRLAPSARCRLRLAPSPTARDPPPAGGTLAHTTSLTCSPPELTVQAA